MRTLHGRDMPTKNRYKGYGIIRDKDGKPRVDDPSTLTPFHIAGLTDFEKRQLGVWDGAFAVGSQGAGRLRKLREAEYYVEEDVAAVNQIIDGTRLLSITPRMDLKRGEHLHIDMSLPRRRT